VVGWFKERPWLLLFAVRASGLEMEIFCRKGPRFDGGLGLATAYLAFGVQV
jgi:hypothetical protein